MHPNGRACIVNQRVLYPSVMMIRAAVWGHSVIVHLTRELGATNIQEAMCSAAENGHLEIVHQCRQWGVTDYDTAMYWAARGGHLEIVRQYRQ